MTTDTQYDEIRHPRGADFGAHPNFGMPSRLWRPDIRPGYVARSTAEDAPEAATPRRQDASAGDPFAPPPDVAATLERIARLYGSRAVEEQAEAKARYEREVGRARDQHIDGVLSLGSYRTIIAREHARLQKATRAARAIWPEEERHAAAERARQAGLNATAESWRSFLRDMLTRYPLPGAESED